MQVNPSSSQLLRDPDAVVSHLVQSDVVHHDAGHLTAPVDGNLVKDPANTVRPTPNLPRRMSVSDRELLDRALASVSASSGSRPGTAEAQRRARTRTRVPTTQAIASEGGARDQANTEVFCLSYSPSGDTLVAGCGDGSLRVFGSSLSVPSLSLQRLHRHSEDAEHLPSTCLRFNPVAPRDDARLLLVATADGAVSHWDLDGAGSSACVRSFREAGSCVYAVDYRADGRQFATGGRDHTVRIYDEEHDTLVRSCESIGGLHGHSNRIFAVRYHSTEPNIILSGGWDNTVQVWDDRTGYSVRSIYGPHICGDALQVSATGAELLTASWRTDDALQRWDFGTGKLLDTIAWNGTDESSRVEPTCMLYACAYSPDERTIAAGGAGNGVNQARLFDAKTSQPTDRVSFQHALYAMAFAPDGSKLAMGGVDPYMTVVSMQ